VSTGSVDAIRIHVTWSTIQRLAPLDEPLAGIFIEPRGGFHDPQIAALVQSMHAEVMAGCPAGRLYGESLSLALAARLVAQHGAPSDRRPESPGGLSRRQFNRVIEYVRANLGSELSLANLADAAQLSPNGFGRAFRNAAGFSPHQLVLRERLREAARLLAEAELPIARIAQVLGFSSQSHFTEVFRKASGTTPRRYQQEL
jgi:AraC family transcriptional regulator